MHSGVERSAYEILVRKPEGKEQRCRGWRNWENNTKTDAKYYIYIYICRSQWPRGLMRRSTAARLLRAWVRIPPGHGYLSVMSVVCCQLEVSATS